MNKTHDDKILNSYKSKKDSSDEHEQQKSIPEENIEIFDILEKNIEVLKWRIFNYKNTTHCSSSSIIRCDIAKNKPTVYYTQDEIDNMLDFKNIVSTFLKNSFDFYEFLEYQPNKIIKGFKKKIYKYESDEKQEIKDIATKFVYNNLLKPNTTETILSLVFKIWDVCVQNYVETFNKDYNGTLEIDDIKLLYRGGNTLSSILEEFLRHTPPLLSSQLKETFGDVMKKSDVDFTIIINPYKYPNGKEYDLIFKQLSFLTLGILSKIKNLIIANKLDIFNPNLGENELKLFLQKLNESESVKNVPENKTDLKGFRFVRIVYDDKYYETENLDDANLNHILGKYNNGCHKNIPGSSHDDIQTLNFGENSIIQTLNFPIYDLYILPNLPTSSLYMTYNEDASFGTSKLINRFSLARLKINFRLFYFFNDKLNVTNFPGEFIDLSVTNNDIESVNLKLDFSAKSDIKVKWDNIKQYKFVKDDGKILEVNSFTIDYYFTDISNILFSLTDYPWNNKKYEKLLKRLFLLSLINLLSKVKEDGTVIKFKTHILDFMELLVTYDIDTLIEHIESVDDSLYYLKLLKFISKVSDKIKESDMKSSKDCEKFNLDVKNLFFLTNGLIKSSFLKVPSTQTIIDVHQSVIKF